MSGQMQQINKTYSEQGVSAFTLLESIVTIAILSTAFLAVFTTLQTFSSANHHSRMLTRAVLLAESKITEVMLADNLTYRTENGTLEPFDWQIRIVPAGQEPLAAVEVCVKWHEQQRPQQYRLHTLLEMPSFTEDH